MQSWCGFIENLSIREDSCAADVPGAPGAALCSQCRGAAPARAGRQRGRREALRIARRAADRRDAITRAVAHGAGVGVGLRGGTFTAAAAAGGFHITLDELRWTEDVAVSGVIDWPGRVGPVHGTLHVKAPQGANGTLEVEWTEGVAQARAVLTGRLGSENLVADAPAP